MARIPGSSYDSRKGSRAPDGSTLTLDFTAMGALDPRITFTRADATPLATYVNSLGYVTTVATAQAARFDFDPTTLVPKGLLIEAPAANVCPQSQTLTTGWLNANMITPTNPAIADPFGGTSATWKLVATSTNATHAWRHAVISLTAAAYTFSFWAKAAEYDRIVLSDPGSGQGACTFVLTGSGTATVITGTVTPTNPQIKQYGNGWYRCSVTMVTSATTYAFGISGYPVGATVGAFGPVYLGDGSGVYATGMQIELASQASSYIPTTTATVTRAADTAIISGTNFSSWYTGGTIGTFVSNWYGNSLSTSARSVVATADVRNRHLHMYQTPLALTLRLADFGAAATATTSNSLTAGALAKGAFSYDGTKVSLCLNGGTVVAGTLAFSVAPTYMSMGGPSTDGTSITDTTVMLNNSIRTLKYFPTRLSDGQIQGLTT